MEKSTEKVRQLIDLCQRVNEAYRQIEEKESAEGKVLSVFLLSDAKDCVDIAQVKRVSEMEEDMSFDYQTGNVVWLNDLIIGKDNSDWIMGDGDSDSELEYEDDGQCRMIEQGSGSTKMMTHAAVLKLPPEMRDRYLQAGRQEIEGWYRNNAIVDVYNPRDANAVFIDSSMNYRLKANGNAKGRACLRGDQMRERTDFDKTFTPTPGATASKIVIALATMQGKPLYTTDNSMAFLNVDIGIDPTDPLATVTLRTLCETSGGLLEG